MANGPSGDTPAARSASSPLARIVRLLGPGLITGAADDCPASIGTFAQAGATYGYAFQWTALLTLPMMATVQYIAAKVAVVHGAGLAGVIRQRYPSPVLYIAVTGLVAANIINAGADLGAMGAAVGMFVPFSVRLLVIPVGLLVLGFLVFGNYNLIEGAFKWLTLALLAYVAAAFLAKPNVGAMLQGTFLPPISLNTAFLSLTVAALGGNVSPYLFFWQADLEVDADQAERGPLRHGSKLALHARLGGVRLDTAIGMVFSNIIIYFIELSSAATLHAGGKHHISTAVQAAEALRPLLGNAATILWAIGILGAGLLAVPALAGSAADAVATTLSWPRGLGQKLDRAKRFYAVLALAVLIAIGINFLGVNPIDALVLAAVVNGFLTPPLLVLLMLLANRKDVMGAQANGFGLNIMGWGTVAIMSIAALALLYTFIA
ncbi:MAG: NRAMP family divalent metal transporter [Chloroflexota bacterium]